MGNCTSQKIKLTLDQLQSIDEALKNQDFKSITNILCELWLAYDKIDKEDQKVVDLLVNKQKTLMANQAVASSSVTSNSTS